MKQKLIRTDTPLPWNGGNAPTCPECGNGNAMLTYHDRPKRHDDVQCRDCGFIVLVDPVEELHDLEYYYELADELWEEAQLGQTAGDIRALVKEIEKLRAERRVLVAKRFAEAVKATRERAEHQRLVKEIEQLDSLYVQYRKENENR